MVEKINQLKEAFCNANSDKERDAVDVQMKELINESPDQFSEAMIASAKQTAEKATKLAMKQRMKDILPAISLVYIAKTYFNKTDAWLYQRINENVVNGKPVSFSPHEMEVMKFALNDLSNKLNTLSVAL